MRGAGRMKVCRSQAAITQGPYIAGWAAGWARARLQIPQALRDPGHRRAPINSVGKHRWWSAVPLTPPYPNYHHDPGVPLCFSLSLARFFLLFEMLCLPVIPAHQYLVHQRSLRRDTGHAAGLGLPFVALAHVLPKTGIASSGKNSHPCARL
jgi:hypothetical protein